MLLGLLLAKRLPSLALVVLLLLLLLLLLLRLRRRRLLRALRHLLMSHPRPGLCRWWHRGGEQLRLEAPIHRILLLGLLHLLPLGLHLGFPLSLSLCVPFRLREHTVDIW